MKTIAAAVLTLAVMFGAFGGGRADAVPFPDVDADTLPAAMEARRLLKGGAYARARDLLRGLVEDGRDSADIHSNLGFALRKLGDAVRGPTVTSARRYSVSAQVRFTSCPSIFLMRRLPGRADRSDARRTPSGS